MPASRHLLPASLLHGGRLGERSAEPVADRRREEVESVPHVLKSDDFRCYKQVFLTAAERTLSGSELYPFERFTESAKRVLTLAQEEAERSHHSYIGTEHLLLGLLRQPDTTATEVLRDLGIELDTVRATIQSVLGRDERILIQQIIPTSRVKKVIEMAF